MRGAHGRRTFWAASRRPAENSSCLASWHLARSVKERGEDGVDLVGGQQGGTVAQAG